MQSSRHHRACRSKVRCSSDRDRYKIAVLYLLLVSQAMSAPMPVRIAADRDYLSKTKNLTNDPSTSSSQEEHMSKQSLSHFEPSVFLEKKHTHKGDSWQEGMTPKDNLQEYVGFAKTSLHDDSVGEEELQDIQDTWQSGRLDTPINIKSHDPHTFTDRFRSNSKDQDTRLYVSSAIRKAQKNGRTLAYTAQRSPFHSSEVGPLSSKDPSPASVGLFRPEYPFLPSGRRRSHSSRKDSNRVPDPREGVIATLPQALSESNLLKHGWTTSILDDDARLSVPDEYRRPRRESALRLAKKLTGQRWYRWKPGEGYVLSKAKDITVYKEGPGIALGQLLPPRASPYTSQLPLIPNDSKRDLAWMVFWWIVLIAILTLASELRTMLRSNRKGKRRSISLPVIQILHDDTSGPLRATSVSSGSTGLRTRQRMQARSFRDICKAALSQSMSQRIDLPHTISRGPWRKASSNDTLGNPAWSKDLMRWQTEEVGDDTTAMILLEKGGLRSSGSIGGIANTNLNTLDSRGDESTYNASASNSCCSEGGNSIDSFPSDRSNLLATAGSPERF